MYTPSIVKPKLPPGQTIRFGLISAALINPPAIHYPSQYFPEVEVIAIATRDKNHAIQYAKTWGISESKAYGGYQALLDDPDVDAVYIGLPNGLHAGACMFFTSTILDTMVGDFVQLTPRFHLEWAIKALQAGKHVLLEKPSASNAFEAREIQKVLNSLTIQPKPVILEAFHYRFHPATVYVRNLLASRKYGKIQSTSAYLRIFSGAMDSKNIRFNFELGGGALMDLTYTVSITRYMLLGPGSGKPKEIVSATPKKLPSDDRIDVTMEAEMIFDVDDGSGGTSEVRSKILSELATPPLFGFIPQIWNQPMFVAECENATITYTKYEPLPFSTYFYVASA